jgi:putative transposase
MIKNHSLARGIVDIGFGEFRRQLQYKMDRRKTELIVVDRFYPSSKTCSGCGHKKDELSLSDRVFYCDHCGLIIDRDLNASINLKKQIGGVPAEFTPVEITALRKSVFPVSVTSIDEAGIKHEVSFNDL